MRSGVGKEADSSNSHPNPFCQPLDRLNDEVEGLRKALAQSAALGCSANRLGASHCISFPVSLRFTT
jgi:hypothetical protein